MQFGFFRRVEMMLKIFNDFTRSIRRIIINNEDVKILGQGEHGVDNIADIITLLIGWYDDNGIVHNQAP